MIAETRPLDGTPQKTAWMIVEMERELSMDEERREMPKRCGVGWRIVRTA